MSAGFFACAGSGARPRAGNCGPPQSVVYCWQNLPFSATAPLDDISRIFERQIRCNMDIAYEGMSGHYGVGIGRMLQ